MNRMINGLMAVLAGCAAGAAELDLAGAWRLTDGERTVAAVVPGGVHDALLAAGEIPDPYFGANETNILWVARRDWTFAREFSVDAAFLAHRSIVLRLEDCDTFCTVAVNGATVGETGDRFRRYDFEVKPFLRAGVNRITGVFRSPVAEADARRAAAGRPYPMANVLWAKNQALIRKPACHAGWDWGPEIETMGFCGTVKLLAADRPRIDYVHTRQTFNDDLSHCTLDVFADLSDGTCVTNRLEIDDPPLWWPNGAGEQRFYAFTVDVNGEKVTKRVGLRKLEILNERTVSADGKDELSLVVRVNNRRLFMKGANWIPCDALERRQTPERYRALLQSARAANMNMIRVWGGGQYEKDVFYDTCDELGLLVWHDLMHACAVYPADAAFLRDIDAELAHQLRRLKDHACIALWCGDNECLGAINWFDEIRADADFYRAAWVARSQRQGELVARYDPARTYWPSSPCCGPGDFGDAWKDDSKGDMHQWDVWHENAPFEKYCDYRPRFCSEFGYQSFSSPAVAATFSDGPGPDFEWHQKNVGGNRRIRETMLRYFGRAKDFASELILSQFQQAMAIQTAVEAWRADMPRCMGTLYWQLNDNWPVASWSSLEYGGKWKPLHYAAKRFYAPVAVVVRPDGTITGLNDTPAAVDGVLTVERWAYDGTAPCARETRRVTLAPDAATRLGALSGAADAAAETFAVVELQTAAGTARAERHGASYRDVALADAQISVAADGLRRTVTLSADRPAFFVWAAVAGADGEFDDNCLTLLPGRPVTLRFSDAFDPARLRVISLVETLARPRVARVKLGDAVKDGRPAARWRGFNLLDLVSWEKDRAPAYREEDFRLLHDWGFNFVRLPTDYRWFADAAGLKAIDDALAFGRRYGIHVQLCLHRLPGYCSGGRLAGEKDLFTDEEPLREACVLWQTFAARYRGVPNEELSFNLFNEPLYMEEADYARVARALVAAIRAEDADRFVLADGLGYGRIAPMTLAGEKGLGFGWHCYDPFFVTHHRTPWNDPDSVKEMPRWPVDAKGPRAWLVDETFASKGWGAALAADVFVYAGEFGVWRKTPHDVALGLMEDQLRLWQEMNCGWALWGLYGGFGVMDSERDDVEYEDFRSHKLDRKLLDLLQRY